MSEFLPVLIIAALIVIFIVSYILNKRTPAPKNAYEGLDFSACKGCSIATCSHHGGEQ